MNLITKATTFLSSKFVRFKPILNIGNQIILKKNTGGHLGEIRNNTPDCYELHQYVTVTKESVLSYLGENENTISFIVRSFYQCRNYDAPDGCVVYFNKNRFINNIDYKIIK